MDAIHLTTGAQAATEVRVSAFDGLPATEILISFRAEVDQFWVQSAIFAFTREEARALIAGINEALADVPF